jgi:hypothetical protein
VFVIPFITVAVNRTLLVYVVMGSLFNVLMKTLDIFINGNGHGNNLTEVIIYTGYQFIVLGAFLFLPVAGTINLVNFALRNVQKKL